MRTIRLVISCKKFFLLAALNMILAALANPTIAGVVTWQTVQAITGDSDVDTTGTPVYAYNFGPASGASQVQGVTVRGVSFIAFGAPIFQFGTQTINIGNVTLSEHPGELNGFDTSANSGSFTTLNSSYKGLLGTAIAASYFSTMTLSLGGLETGKSYRLQLWVNDSKNDQVLYKRVEVSGGGSTSEIKTNVSSTLGGLGQYVIGTFTATGNIQDVLFNGMLEVGGINNLKNPFVNAFQLRLESSGEVPEPASMVIFGLGALGLACRKRRRTIV
jgi:hypothetical protein